MDVLTCPNFFCAQSELFALLGHDHLAGAAILVMANKQDLKDAMSVKDLSDVLALHTIKRHDWHIQVRLPCWCARNSILDLQLEGPGVERSPSSAIIGTSR